MLSLNISYAEMLGTKVHPGVIEGCCCGVRSVPGGGTICAGTGVGVAKANGLSSPAAAGEPGGGNSSAIWARAPGAASSMPRATTYDGVVKRHEARSRRVVPGMDLALRTRPFRKYKRKSRRRTYSGWRSGP